MKRNTKDAFIRYCPNCGQGFTKMVTNFWEIKSLMCSGICVKQWREKVAKSINSRSESAYPTVVSKPRSAR